jgi:DNA polymerase-4
MKKMHDKDKIIFHIDVNSAYLSWEAVYRLQHGASVDLRKIPSVVGGDPKTRHGIVLAKSIPAKKYRIKTGETLYEATNKCPNLTIVAPNYALYMKCSDAMINILKEYSPHIQRFSVDECFLNFTNLQHLHGNPVSAAHRIKEQIKKKLGFTVSIGVSSNKLLAKMGSDLKKPDAVTTLFPEEIKEKMWPLPIEDLYMVGRDTASKLYKMGIYTIGDLAKADLNLIKYKLKSHGEMIWRYANGIETSDVRMENYITRRGLGNSTTVSFDVEDRPTAHLILLSLTEMTAMRLRDSENLCSIVSVKAKNP